MNYYVRCWAHYDRPSSLMKRLGNPELSATARKLDAKRVALAERVTAV
jgi:hypothetical protein